MSCVVEFTNGGTLESEDRAGLLHTIVQFYADQISGFRYPDIKEVRVYIDGDENGKPISKEDLREFESELDRDMRLSFEDFRNS